MRTSRVASVAGVALLGGAATALAVAPRPPTGNHQAIKIARAEIRAYSAVPAETVDQTGLVAMTTYKMGNLEYFNWWWGHGVPQGWVPATEHSVVALAHRRVVWWRDDLVPPPCSGSSCHELPVEIVVTKNGNFFAFGNAKRHDCYAPLKGPTLLKVGQMWGGIANGARYLAPVHRHGVIVLTYSYPWSPSQATTETDVISSRTFLGIRGKLTITAGTGPNLPAFTITYANTQPKQAPPAPHINRCPH